MICGKSKKSKLSQQIKAYIKGFPNETIFPKVQITGGNEYLPILQWKGVICCHGKYYVARGREMYHF